MIHKKLFSGILVGVMLFSICFVSAQSVVTQEEEYLFTLTLMAPFNNPVRVQHAQVIALELQKIGIKANVVYHGWDTFVVRMFGALNHEDYANGGFDSFFVGWSSNQDPGLLYNHFHSSHIDPVNWDNNMYPVNNATLDNILEFISNTTDFDQRKEWVRQALEIIMWDIHPVTGIYQDGIVFFMRDNVEGFNALQLCEEASGFEELFFSDGQSQGHGQVNEIIFAQSQNPQNYNPFLSNSVFEDFVWGSAFNMLVEKNESLHPIPGLLTKLPYPVAVRNNFTGEISSTDPNFATVWEIELRDDIYWHEGYNYTMADDADILKIDADDVEWFYRAMIDNDGPPVYNHYLYQSIFSDEPEKGVHKVDETHVQFHLISIYPMLMSLFGYVLPQHILDPTYDAGYGSGVRKDGTSAPNYQDWWIDDFNLGRRTSGDTTRAATIGCGPYYIYPGINETAQSITLNKWTHYFRDNDEYWGPLVENRPDKYIVKIMDRNQMVDALKSGDIDIMETGNEAKRVYSTLEGVAGIKNEQSIQFGYQIMAYNILNGADGILANKWVRLAISHMIPRQEIIDYLLGFGVPSFTLFPCQSPFWPKDLELTDYNRTRAIEFMELAGYDMTPYKPASISPAMIDSPAGLDDEPQSWKKVGPSTEKRESQDASLTNYFSDVFPLLAFLFALSVMTGVIVIHRHRKVVRN